MKNLYFLSVLSVLIAGCSSDDLNVNNFDVPTLNYEAPYINPVSKDMEGLYYNNYDQSEQGTILLEADHVVISTTNNKYDIDLKQLKAYYLTCRIHIKLPDGTYIQIFYWSSHNISLYVNGFYYGYFKPTPPHVDIDTPVNS